MKFRPCIDLHRGKVKQIVGSTLSDKLDRPVTNFESERSAAFFASLYREDALTGGHVILLGPGNDAAAAEALTAFPGGLQVGGGIRPGNAAAFLDQGASHVIVTSYVFAQGAVLWDRLEEMARIAGKERLVLDLSCRRVGGAYVVATDRWQTSSGVALSPELLEQCARYCDEFLVHAVDVEGKRAGIDGDLVAFLAEASPIVATYAGGIRSIDDLEEIRLKGKDRVDATIGSALDIFGGELAYAGVVAWHRKRVAHIS
jgi:phosphoribosylformimino-5-aminoimidazole carboxamide ribotide isomerase